MKRNKIISLGLAASLAVTSLAVTAAADDEANVTAAAPTITAPVIPAAQKHKYSAKMELADNFKSVKAKSATFYNFTSDNTETHYLYFFNGNNSVPYMELTQLFKLYKQVAHSDVLQDYTLDVDCGYTKDKFYVFRENGTRAVFNFTPRTVLEFDDYDKFVIPSNAISGGDICMGNRWQLNEDGTVKTDENGNALVKLIYTPSSAAFSFERSGYSRKLYLQDGGIDLYIRNGKAYMPLATFSDVFLSTWMTGYVYNGKSVFLTTLDGFDTETKNDAGKTMADLFADIGNTKRTKALAEFTYKELVFMLDLNYGLWEEHNIFDFDKYLDSIGLKERMLSTDAAEFDKALSELLGGYFGDLHSGFGSASPFDPNADDPFAYYLSTDVVAPAMSKTFMDSLLYMGARMSGNNVLDKDNKVIPYKEVGDTAYITFDQFHMEDDTDFYYTDEFKNNVKDYIDSDVIALVYYANQRVHRKNSPVKNVVIDLSCNGGGAVDSAVFLVSWLLGYCSISTVNARTYAQYTVRYQADVNLDGLINGDDRLNGDKLDGINIYCLTSPNSFSCGNLVPAYLKESGTVTILGKTSGGGACAVQPAVTADGTFYQFSGKFKLCTTKNGSYYQIDAGITPDITITKLEHFYDRKWLTKYIDELP